MLRHDGFAPFRRLGGRVPIALDGTEYFGSKKLGCTQCLTRRRSNGKVESYHSMLFATVVAPGYAMAPPPMPVLGFEPGITAPGTAPRSRTANPTPSGAGSPPTQTM